MRWLLLVLALALVGCGAAADSGTVGNLPTPSPTPQYAADPTVAVTHDNAGTFTITATNEGPGPCHHLELHVLGRSGADSDPQGELQNGITDGRVYPYTDVAVGQTVTATLAAKAILQADPSQGFKVGAVGYCQDSRGR